MSHAPTLNQSLLGLALDEGRIKADECRVFLDEARLQPVVYLLGRLGTPFAYIFALRFSGPFSSALSADLKTLTKARMLHHLPRTPGQYAEYVPIEPLEPLWGRHVERIAEERERLRQNVGALLPLDMEELRLLSSLDSVHRTLREAVPPAKLEAEVLATLATVSRGRYPRQRMAETYGFYAASPLAAS